MMKSLVDATHIFDGLNDFPTHVAHMRLGQFTAQPEMWNSQNGSGEGSASGSPLHGKALRWLKEDREYRLELEKRGRKVRGARSDGVCCFYTIAVVRC